MTTPRLPVLAFATAAVLLSACWTPKAPPPPRHISIEWSNPTTTFPRLMRLDVAVDAPDGTRYQANGQINKGGTVRALCHSLNASLHSFGCEATYRDATSTDDELARSMHQIVEVPEGWRVVFAQPTRRHEVDADRLKVSILPQRLPGRTAR